MLHTHHRIESGAAHAIEVSATNRITSSVSAHQRSMTTPRIPSCNCRTRTWATNMPSRSKPEPSNKPATSKRSPCSCKTGATNCCNNGSSKCLNQYENELFDKTSLTPSQAKDSALIRAATPMLASACKPISRTLACFACMPTHVANRQMLRHLLAFAANHLRCVHCCVQYEQDCHFA